MLWISEEHFDRTRGYCFEQIPLYETRYENNEVKKLFLALQKEYGRCRSRVYVDKSDGTHQQVGWVFEKRNQYDDCNEKYTREVWVTVKRVVDVF